MDIMFLNFCYYYPLKMYSVQRLGGGENSFSSDLIGVFKPTLSQVKLCQYSVKLYQELESQGFQTGWKQCGSLCVARTRDRMTVFRRMKSQSG